MQVTVLLSQAQLKMNLIYRCMFGLEFANLILVRIVFGVTYLCLDTFYLKCEFVKMNVARMI